MRTEKKKVFESRFKKSISDFWHESALKYYHFLGMLFEEYHAHFLGTLVSDMVPTLKIDLC